MNKIFLEAYKIILTHEGGFQNIHNDRGNWTSGKIGVGINKGTKFGITAMSYPNLDIKNLTLQDAQNIYKRDYWDEISGDNLYPSLALVAFDTAINSGVGKAKEFLNLVTNDEAGVDKFLQIRQKYIRGLKLYHVVPTSSRSGRTYGQIWEDRIATLRQQASSFGRMFPNIQPSSSQERQEGASKESSGVRVLADFGEGFKELTVPHNSQKIDVSVVGDKVYLRVK